MDGWQGLDTRASVAHATLKHAPGMDGLLMIGRERQATLIWLEDRADIRERLMQSVRVWADETGVALPGRSYLPQT